MTLKVSFFVGVTPLFVSEKIPAGLFSACRWDLGFYAKAPAAYICRLSVLPLALQGRLVVAKTHFFYQLQKSTLPRAIGSLKTRRAKHAAPSPLLRLGVAYTPRSHAAC
jgi:hypothetical protein